MFNPRDGTMVSKIGGLIFYENAFTLYPITVSITEFTFTFHYFMNFRYYLNENIF